MKYVLLFCGSPEGQAAYDAMTPEQRQANYGPIMAWFQEHGAKIKGGEELQSPETATTVVHGADGTTMVKDGLFLEGKEIVGGYAEVEVEHLDDALAMARTWPGGGAVEIRPVVHHG